MSTQASEPRIAPTTPDQRAWVSLTRAHVAAMRRFNGELSSAHGLTINDYEALLVLSFPALDLAGVKLTVGLHPEQLTRWLTESGARIILLILLAFAANRFAASVITPSTSSTCAP